MMTYDMEYVSLLGVPSVFLEPFNLHEIALDISMPLDDKEQRFLNIRKSRRRVAQRLCLYYEIVFLHFDGFVVFHLSSTTRDKYFYEMSCA